MTQGEPSSHVAAFDLDDSLEFHVLELSAIAGCVHAPRLLGTYRVHGTLRRAAAAPFRSGADLDSSMDAPGPTARPRLPEDHAQLSTESAAKEDRCRRSNHFQPVDAPRATLPPCHLVAAKVLRDDVGPRGTVYCSATLVLGE
jgi:hypothetical protein